MKAVRLVLMAVLLLLILLPAGAYFFVKSTLPDYEGEHQVPGINGRIEIFRDRAAVPHIFADHQDDLAFGMGYAMAQDRLWQMDLFRRAATGRLSEIFGERTLAADRLTRVLGFRRDAVESESSLSSEERTYLESFVRGINTYIGSQSGERPIEFRVLGYAPDPFTPTDVIALAHFQSYASNHNWKQEVLRASAIAELGEGRGRELSPALTFHGPYMALPGFHDPSEGIPANRESSSTSTHGRRESEQRLLAALLQADALIEQISGLQGNQAHSNFWIVSGEHSKSGKPILANDYHMPFLLPSLWYELHLVGDGADAAGITLPGFPTIIAGHNRSIAWGATTTGADTQDLFRERLNPDDHNQYLYEGTYHPFETIDEEIRYKAEGELRTERLVVRISRHGPIINSITRTLSDDGSPLALQSVAGASRGQVAFCMQIFRASNWKEFKAALALSKTPIWNWGYADDAGNIGFTVNGMIPIRSRGNGLEPVPGWSGEHEWEGTIPFEELPEVFNPPTGYIVSANNEILDPSYPYSIFGSAFALPYRAIRIEELLRAKKEMTLESMRDIQSDTHSRFGLQLSEYILEAATTAGVGDESFGELTDHLSAWDGTSDVDSVAASIVQEFLVKLMKNTFSNKISQELYEHFLEPRNLNYAAGVLLLMLRDDSLEHWFDDPTTQAVESRQDTIIKSLAEASDSLGEVFGDRVSDWRWGEIHQITFKHRLGSIAPFKWLWNIGPAEFPGDLSTVNPGRHGDLGQKPYQVTAGASMRHVIDFGNFEDSGLVITTGQSGRWSSPNYDDQAELWHGMEYLEVPMNREEIEKEAIGRTVLVPSE
jgi:penicillin amidase